MLNGRRTWAWAVAVVAMIAVPPALAQDVDVTALRLRDADAEVLRRVLPVWIATAERQLSSAAGSVMLADSHGTWEDSVEAGRIDLVARLEGLVGRVPVPTGVRFDKACTLNASGPLEVQVVFRSVEPLPVPPPLTEGILATAGVSMQQGAAVQRRNARVVLGWKSVIMAAGFPLVRDETGFSIEFRRTPEDRVPIVAYLVFPCGFGDSATDPAIVVTVPTEVIRAGRWPQTGAESGPEMLLETLGVTMERFEAVLGAATLTRTWRDKGLPGDGVPESYWSPELREMRAVAQQNLAWRTRHDAVVGALLDRWEAIQR